jgi:hypothetical protein
MNKPPDQPSRRPNPEKARSGAGNRRPAPPRSSGELQPLLVSVVNVAKEVAGIIGVHAPHHFYRTALAERLAKEHPGLKQRLTGVLKHRGHRAGELQADLSIGDELLVNVHTRDAGFSVTDAARLTSALKFFHHRHGLLLGFGGAEVSVQKLSEPHEPFPSLAQEDLLKEAPMDAGERNNATMLIRSLLRVARANQLGYDALLWKGLLLAELAAESLTCSEVPPAPLIFDGKELGKLNPHGLFEFQGRGIVLVTALQERLQPAEVATLRHFLSPSKHAWGLALHFSRRRLEWRWVKP